MAEPSTPPADRAACPVMSKIDTLRGFFLRDLGLEGSCAAADLDGAVAAVARTAPRLGAQAAYNLLLRGEVGRRLAQADAWPCTTTPCT